MLTASDKRWAFLIVMSGFMERYAPEIEAGMTDARLTECVRRMMRFRLIWGGPGRFQADAIQTGLKSGRGQPHWRNPPRPSSPALTSCA